jgi:hypothetical protein
MPPPQEFPQISTGAYTIPTSPVLRIDILINCFMADVVRRILAGEPSCYLFGRPSYAKLAMDIVPHKRMLETLTLAPFPNHALGSFMGYARMVSSIAPETIAFQFSAYGSRGSSEIPGNPPKRFPLPEALLHTLPFLKRELHILFSHTLRLY